MNCDLFHNSFPSLTYHQTFLHKTHLDLGVCGKGRDMSRPGCGGGDDGPILHLCLGFLQAGDCLLTNAGGLE
jgi:hypothetical protein